MKNHFSPLSKSKLCTEKCVTGKIQNRKVEYNAMDNCSVSVSVWLQCYVCVHFRPIKSGCGGRTFEEILEEQLKMEDQKLMGKVSYRTQSYLL